MSSENNASGKGKGVEEMQGRYLAFSLNDEQYAIPLLQVKEVIGIVESTPIPQTPKYFKGIINLRGQIISIIDLQMKLAISAKDTSAKTSIIILDLDQICLGVIVDSINSVMALTEKELSPVPEGMGKQDRYLLGVARHEENLTLILDIQAILSEQDVITLRKQNSYEDKQAA